MRIVAGVIVGYLTFAIPAGLMFYLSGHQPHDAASMRFMVLSTLCGVLFAGCGGWVAVKLSQRGLSASVLAVLLAAIAVASMLSTPPGRRWSQWAALIFMAPAVLLGGRFEKSH